MAASIGSLYVSMTVDARPYVVGMNRVQDATRRAAGQIRRDVGVATSSVNTFSRSIGSRSSFRPYAIIAATRAFDSASDRAQLLRGSLLSLTAVAGGFAAALASNVVLRYADTFTNLRNQIRTVTSDTADLNATTASLAEVARRSRASLEATATIYARTSRAVEHLGYSQEQLLQVTETIQKAFAVGGATTQEAWGAAIQLSQGIASNRFSGDEFRSVAENAPVLLRGMAESLGVTIGKLREMAHAGELTADVVVKAILNAGGRIESEFGRTIISLDRSITQLENSLTTYIGRTNEAYGVTRLLGEGIIGVSDNLDTIIPLVGLFAAGLATVFTSRLIASGAGKIHGYFGAIGAEMRQAGMEAGELVARMKTLQDQRRDLINQIVNQRAVVSEAGARAKTAGRGGAPSQAQIDAVAALDQKLRDLTQQRLVAENKITAAKAASLSRAQQSVDAARNAVRAEQDRVSAIQNRIVAEQRAIVGRSQKGVDDRVAAAQKMQNDLAAIDEKIAVERTRIETRAAEDIAKKRARLDKSVADAKISLARREAAVIEKAEQERAARARVTDLRSVQALPDFQKVFGKEYEQAIRQQGRAIVDSQKAVKDLTDARQRLMGAEKEASAFSPKLETDSKRLAALEQSRAKLVEGLAESQRHLASAEKLAADARAGLVSSSKLDKLLAQEGTAITAYQKKVVDLQKASAELRNIASGSIQTPGVARAVGDLDKLDNQIRKVSTNLDTATRAMDDAARSFDRRAFARAADDFTRAGVQLTRLQTELIGVNKKIAETGPQISALQARVGAFVGFMGRIGRDLMGLFGGPVGVAVTTAIVAFGFIGAAAAREAQRVRDARQLISAELDRLGQGEKATPEARKSSLELRYDETVKELREIKNRADDARVSLSRIFALQSNAVATTVRSPFASQLREIEDLTKQYFAGRISIVEYTEKIDEMQKAVDSDIFKKLSEEIIKNTLDISNASIAVDGYTDKIKDLQKELRNQGNFESLARRREDANVRRGADFLQERTRRTDLSEEQREFEDLTAAILEAAEKQAKALGKTVTVYRQQAEDQARYEIAAKKANKEREEEAKRNEELAKSYVNIGKKRAEELELLTLIGDEKKRRGYEIDYVNDEVRAGAELTAELHNRAKAYANERLALENASDAKEEEIKRQEKLREVIEELRIEPAIAKLSAYDQEILAAGKSAGATTEEVKKFVAAAATGDVKNIPDIFRGIADAMRDVNAASLDRAIEGIKRLQAETESMRALQRMHQKDIDKYVESSENEIRVNNLRAKGRELDARVEAEFFRLTQAGVKISREAVEATEAKRLAAEKAADAAKKSSREVAKENREIEKTINIIARLKREGDAAFFSDVDRAVIQNLRNIKDAEEALRQYMEAVQTGDFSNVPKDIMDVRDAELSKQAAEEYRRLVETYGTGAQLADLFAQKQEILNAMVTKSGFTVQQVEEIWADFLTKFRDYQWIDNVSNAIGDFARDAILDFENMEESVKSFVRRLAEIALQVVILEPLVRSLRSALSGVAGSGGGIIGFLSSLIGGGAGGGTGPFGYGKLYHSGGRVGPGGMRRSVSPAAFAGAPRLHSGLTSNEFGAILQKGEHVMTERMANRTAATIDGLSKAAAASGGSGPGVTIYEAEGAGVASVQQNDDGSLEITLGRMIDDRIADSVGARGSAGRSMEKMYGLNRTRGLKRRRT